MIQYLIKLQIIIIVAIGVVMAIVWMIWKLTLPTRTIHQPGTSMRLTSTAFHHNKSIPSKYTCDGDGMSPPLAISGVPTNAKDLVLIVDDPDAPKGTWVHWTIWNMDPTINEIPEGTMPADSTQGVTSYGRLGYGVPCPPSGTHRYFFKLYALDQVLKLKPSAKAEDIMKAIDDHIIDSAELIGLYQRNG